ncbi:MAG: oligosaccharide flippase family protein [SAR324 cluster bacterium]|nr:oligosaccharide flippase family protein [SAR324 cluster bacterium]
MDLGTRTLQAVIWLFGLRIITRGIGLLRNVVLARMLTPGDFGLLGIAVLTAGFLEVFTRSGLEHSVIQRSQVSRHELNALWTFDALRGLLLSALMFLAAPAIGAVVSTVIVTVSSFAGRAFKSLALMMTIPTPSDQVPVGVMVSLSNGFVPVESHPVVKAFPTNAPVVRSMDSPLGVISKS